MLVSQGITASTNIFHWQLGNIAIYYYTSKKWYKNIKQARKKKQEQNKTIHNLRERSKDKQEREKERKKEKSKKKTKKKTTKNRREKRKK